MEKPIVSITYEWSEEFYSQFASILHRSIGEKIVGWFPIVITFIIGGQSFASGDFIIGSLFCLFGILIWWNWKKGYSSTEVYK
ncbi:MAG: hypothetical protein K2M10_10015, partial [Muribaculaceae bacterium]|nr:hypothetical protein [Muribaculaceae bacterium]